MLHCTMLCLTLPETDYLWHKNDEPEPEHLGLHFAPFAMLCSREGRPVRIDAAIADPRFMSNPLVTGWPTFRSVCCAPIRSNGLLPTAALWIASPQSNQFCDKSLEEFARLIELDLRNYYTAESKRRTSTPSPASTHLRVSRIASALN